MAESKSGLGVSHNAAKSHSMISLTSELRFSRNMNVYLYVLFFSCREIDVDKRNNDVTTMPM